MVRDGRSNQPLEHVQISLPATGIGGLTREHGRIDLWQVPVGDHRVVAELIGYGEVAQTVTVVEGETAVFDIRLSETAIELGGVVVTEERAGGAPGGVVRVVLDPESPDPDPPLPPSVADRPIFTPFSRVPAVVNEEDVQEAMAAAYPPGVRDDGIDGTVGVYFYVDTGGAVRDVRIHRSSGHQSLDDAALATAGVFRFSPALNRDQPRSVWVSFPITFLGAPG
jgi:TonB family protein